MALPARVSFRVFVSAVGLAALLPTVVLLPIVLGAGRQQAKAPHPQTPRLSRAPTRRPAVQVFQPSATSQVVTRNVFRPLVRHGKEADDASGLPSGLFGPGPLAPAGFGAAGGAALTVEPSLGEWAWVGTASIGRDLYAIMQSRKTKAGSYVRAGDTLGNGRVVSVTPTALLVRVADKLSSIALSTGEAGAPPGGTGPAKETPKPSGPTPPSPASPALPPGPTPNAPPPGSVPPQPTAMTGQGAGSAPAAVTAVGPTVTVEGSVPKQ